MAKGLCLEDAFTPGVIKLPVLGDQTMQIYGKFEEFPLIVHCSAWYCNDPCTLSVLCPEQKRM